MLYRNFIEVNLSSSDMDLAIEHATLRTENIVRQFVPRNAPLSHLESNVVGVLGEIAVYRHLGVNYQLSGEYDEGEVDDGDLHYNELVYDIKTDAVPNSSYTRLRNGTIRIYEPYGCRVFTARHLHHLRKYTGGLIFTAIKIPDNARHSRVEGKIRDFLKIQNNVIIIGYVEQNEVTENAPTWYAPQRPDSRRVIKYNSLNYIFHHNVDIRQITEGPIPSQLRNIQDLRNV